MKLELITVIIVLSFSLASCINNPQAAPTDTFSPPAPVDTLTPAPTEPAVVERAAIQALSSRYNIPIGQVHVIKSEQVTWPTGCLGVVVPSVLCTDHVVDGFRVTLEADGKQYEFHTDKEGSTVIDAAQIHTTLRFAVLGSPEYLGVSLVSPNIPPGDAYNPAFTGLMPAGGTLAGTAYVLDFSQNSKALAVNENGTNELAFIEDPTHGLALWPGAGNIPPRLGWGTQLLDPHIPSILQIANLDGSDRETLLTEVAASARPRQFVTQAWSADGQWLYYSSEPVGVGGYINFAGASNLYRINITTKKVNQLVGQDANISCLDALSPDLRFAADHCAQTSITVRQLSNGATLTIVPPAGTVGYNFAGSARFSPAGDLVAFALARGDPTAEQGWLVLADARSGNARVIFGGQPGSYSTIQGWLNDQTLLIEIHGLACSPICIDELWTIRSDGSNLSKVAEGSFLTVMQKP